MKAKTLKRLFPLGHIVATPAAMDKMDPRYALSCLELHHSGDWGMVDDHDRAVNEDALKTGGRLMSVYPLPGEAGDFWVITESDRSITTILLPSDY